MIRQALVLTAFAFVLISCGPQKTTSSTPNPRAKPNPGQPTPAEAQNYVQSTQLNLLTTQTEITADSKNLVRFQGVGLKSTYKAIYSFNSAGQNSLNVLSSYSTAKFCSNIRWNYVLKRAGKDQPLNSLGSVSILPHTEYQLEISLGEHQCPQIEIDLEVMVWAGHQQQLPTMALICTGQRTGVVDFLVNDYPGQAYSHIRGEEKYLTDDTYCGEKVDGFSNRECKMSLPRNGRTAATSCTFKKEFETRSYSVDFDLISKTAQVSCFHNDQSVFTESFHDCRYKVVDKAIYKDL